MIKNFFKNLIYQAWEIVKIVVISLVIIVPIRYFVVQPFFVKGASMEPNFEDGDYLLIDEISPRFKDYQRGDVIVFHYPQNPKLYFIKRVIGLPGEEIEVQEGRVLVSAGPGEKKAALLEAYLPLSLLTVGDLKITLKTDEYFVLGDNRNASSDSRRWGAVNKSFITGRVWVRAWPIAHAGLIEEPDYSADKR